MKEGVVQRGKVKRASDLDQFERELLFIQLSHCVLRGQAIGVGIAHLIQVLLQQ